MTDAYAFLYNGTLIVIGVLLLFCLIRAIRGPRIADRVISINMMGTLIVITICVLAFLMNEGVSGGHRDDLHDAVLPRGCAADEDLHGCLPRKAPPPGSGRKSSEGG